MFYSCSILRLKEEKISDVYLEIICNYSQFLKKWVNWIFWSKRLFFSTQLLLKIPVFDLNNRFVFYRTLAVVIQSKFKFLNLTHDFLASSNTVTSSVYKFLFILVREMAEWLMHSASLPKPRIGQRVWFPYSPGRCRH